MLNIPNVVMTESKDMNTGMQTVKFNAKDWYTMSANDFDELIFSMMKAMKPLSEQFSKELPRIKTEEHTKTALILPFLSSLGWNVTSSSDLIPEYTCDFGVKRGEKVDYALMHGNSPYILVECKSSRNTLTNENISQLFRYFSVSPARLAILTNGVEYMMFTDSVSKNIMDTKPFYVFNVLSIRKRDIRAVALLLKSLAGLDGYIDYFVKQTHFERNFRKWGADQSKGISDSFLRFIKKEMSCYDLPDSIIRNTVQTVMFKTPNIRGEVVKQTEKESLKKEEQLSAESSLQVFGKHKEVDIKESSISSDDVMTSSEIKKKASKNAIGVTGIFSLADENLEELIAGSTLCSVEINDKKYDVSAIYQILFSMLDYLLDYCKLTAEDIIKMNEGMTKRIFLSSGSTSREHRGVCMPVSISGSNVIQYACIECDIFSVNKTDFVIGLIDKETKKKLTNLGVSSDMFADYIRKLDKSTK